MKMKSAYVIFVKISGPYNKKIFKYCHFLCSISSYNMAINVTHFLLAYLKSIASDFFKINDLKIGSKIEKAKEISNKI